MRRAMRAVIREAVSCRIGCRIIALAGSNAKNGCRWQKSPSACRTHAPWGRRFMRDLTQGAIWRHLVGMALFIGVGLVVQTLYMLIDLYFVARLGKEAGAGV